MRMKVIPIVVILVLSFSVPAGNVYSYLKDRFNYEHLILRFGYPAHFAGTNNCGIAKQLTTPTNN